MPNPSTATILENTISSIVSQQAADDEAMLQACAAAWAALSDCTTTTTTPTTTTTTTPTTTTTTTPTTTTTTPTTTTTTPTTTTTTTTPTTTTPTTTTTTTTTEALCIDPTSGIAFPAYPPSVNIMGGPTTRDSSFGPTTYSLIGTLSMQPDSCYFYSGDPIWHEEPDGPDAPHQHTPSYTDLQYLPSLGHWQLVNEHNGTYTGGSLASPVGSYAPSNNASDLSSMTIS